MSPISGNIIGKSNVANSGSSQAHGLSVSANGQGDVNALIENNNIYQYSNLAGINLLQGDGDGTLDATVRGNDVDSPGLFASNGILAVSGTSVVTDAGTACFDLGHPSSNPLKNTVAGSGANGGTDLRLRHRANTTMRLPGYAGSAFDTAAVIAYVVARNQQGPAPTGSATTSTTGGGFVNVASCQLPTP